MQRYAYSICHYAFLFILICLPCLVEHKENDEEELAVYTWEEIVKHNNAESLWMVLHNKVYDVTKFMAEVCCTFVLVIINADQFFKNIAIKF